MISLVIDKNHGHGHCLDWLLYRLLDLSDEVGLIVMLFVMIMK